MFWDKWIPAKYLVKSEVCGLEVNFKEGSADIYYSILKKKSRKLELSGTGTASNISELPPQILKNKIPLVIIFNGRGIIIKKLLLNENSDLSFDQLLKQNMPAVNENDFYVQMFRQESSAFISICRREQVNKILSELKEKKHDIAGILLGAPAAIGLQPLWSNFNNLPCSTQQVQLTNGAIDAIVSKEQELNEQITIDDINFTSSYSLGFAGGLSYLMRRKIAETVNSEILELENSHYEKNKFRFLMIVIVAVSFFLAAVNVFFYTGYFDKNNKLETELSIYQGKYEQVNKLLNDYQKKKDLIENAGILNKNKISEFADRIAKTIPEEVILTELYFNPKKSEEESADSLVTFQNNQLIIKGNCNKSLIINEWVNVLKMQKFIKDVSLEKFAYSNEGILPNYEIRLLTE